MTMPIGRSLSVLLACSLAAQAASAQSLLYQFTDFGDAVSSLPDVDGDGHPDLAVARAGGPGLVGRVSVRSGTSGDELFSLTGANAGDGFGWALARVPDLDGDGLDDLAVGTPLAASPHVRLVRSTDGATLFTVSTFLSGDFGSGLAAGGDVDGDGISELLVACPSSDPLDPNGKVMLVSLVGQSVLRFHTTYGESGGLTFLDDVDGDGFDDYAFGVPTFLGFPVAGRVEVLSGATGATLQVHQGSGITDRLGASLAGLADVDGDGAGELAIGAPGVGGGPFSPGEVRLLLGATGAELFTYQPHPGPLEVGTSLLAMGDVDGDGLEDLAVLYPWIKGGDVIKNKSRILILSSATAGVLESLSAYNLAGPVTTAGDLNLDGSEDFLISSPNPLSPSSTSIVVLRNAPFPDSFCGGDWSSQGCWNSWSIEGTSSLTVGNGLELQAQDVDAQSVGLFLWGAVSGSMPFAGGTLCLAPPFTRGPPQATGGTPGTCEGTLDLSFDKAALVASGIPAGSALHMQFFVRDLASTPPDASSSSTAFRFTIWP